jgi:iron complex outermembrane receptor protein
MVSGERSALFFNTGGEYHLLTEDRLYIKFDYGHNTRMPTLDDLYYQPGGNPELKSEESKSAEVSIVFNEETVEGGFSSTASIYRSDVKNWIIWLPRIDNATWAPQNIDLVETAGLELNLNYSGKWREVTYGIRGIYAYSSSVNYGMTEASYGKQLPYIPLHSANMNMNISVHGFSLIYTWNYFSERFPYMSNESYSLRDELYPYFMNQMRIGKNVEFNKIKLDVNLAIYNLLNEEYRSVLQRPMPGRNFHLMIRVGF